MSELELSTLFHRYVAALNGRSINLLPELVADEVEHNGERVTRDEWWDRLIAPNVRAVPDLTWHVDDLVVAGDRIAVRYTDSGTPVAPFLGRAPDGTKVRFAEHVFYRVVGGRIAETWSLVDQAAVRDEP